MDRWHGVPMRKILFLLLIAIDLAWGAHAKPCSFPYYRANPINVARSTHAKGHDRAKVMLFGAI